MSHELTQSKSLRLKSSREFESEWVQMSNILVSLTPSVWLKNILTSPSSSESQAQDNISWVSLSEFYFCLPTYGPIYSPSALL